MLITMESTINQRLTEVIKYTKLKDFEFAGKIQATKQEVSRWQKGVKLPLHIVSKIFENWPEINGNWFFTGLGNMLHESDESGQVLKKRGCNDPVCISEKSDLHKQIDQLHEAVINLQKEKIAWLEKKGG